MFLDEEVKQQMAGGKARQDFEAVCHGHFRNVGNQLFEEEKSTQQAKAADGESVSGQAAGCPAGQ